MNTLNTKLKEKLATITGLECVYEYPWLDFDGYPAATITPSGNESDYETQGDNLRTYAYIIRLFVNLKTVNQNTKKEKVQDGYRIMRELIDSVTDLLDQDETLSGIQTSLPSDKTMIAIRPVPSAINYFDEEEMLLGEIRVRCLISFDTNT